MGSAVNGKKVLEMDTWGRNRVYKEGNETGC